MQNTAAFPWQLLFIFCCLDKDISTWQKKTIHICSNKSLIIDSKQTLQNVYLHEMDWNVMSFWKFFQLVHLGTLPILENLSMSASHVQVTASKQKVLLFEQGRHVALGTDGTQANSP